MASLVKKYSKEKLTGQIFTPFYIVEKILDDIGYNSAKILAKKIIDPACGDGRFLLKIVERILKFSPTKQLKKNLLSVYGWDIDKKAVNIARKKLDQMIAPYHLNIDWNIKVQNSFTPSVQKFDFIVGNPPYIRIQHLDLSQRQFIQQQYSFCQSGSTDIYIAFYQIALNLLHKKGICGYITPNTFFNTDTAKYLRKFFASNQNIKQITNYGHIQLFKDATTYSAITIFDSNKRDNFLYQHADNNKNFQQRLIDFNEIKNKKFWQLSMQKPTAIKGKRLGDIAKIHVGITTLADKIYMLSLAKKAGDYFYLNSKHNGLVKIEKSILQPIIKASTLKNADDPIKEYVLFPYQKNNGRHKIIAETKLQQKYPFAYQYLSSVKAVLAKRDNGNPNLAAWYAFGRTQSLDSSFGKKILFSPMNKEPKFIYSNNEDATFYSGYCIKYNGDIDALLAQINSTRMAEFIKNSARDFRGGWKSYNKKIVQEFVAEIK